MLVGGREPEWIPFTLDVGAVPGFTTPVLRRFRAETGADDPAEFFDCDFRTFSLPTSCGAPDPASGHEDAAPGTTFDEWGIGHWAGGGEATPPRMFPPLAGECSVRDVEFLPTPVIHTDADTSPIAVFKERGYPVLGYAGSVYEWSWWLRGMETFMMDLVAEPALAQAVIRKVAGYTKELALASAGAGIDVLCFYDDAGMQTGMQISPRLWREFVKPAWADVLAAVRRRFPDAICFLHCCGGIGDIVPDIIDLGFDILHPVQPECMSFEDMRREFGRDIVLCATLSAQKTLPFGTPRDVRAEVRRLKGAADDNRCILCPSNLVQPETPWENIVAFAEEARGDLAKGGAYTRIGVE